MILYLVQHGEALSKEADPLRPLSETGRRAVRSVGAQLAVSGCRVAAIAHSGKARADETAAILADCLKPNSPAESRSGLAPNDAVAPLASEAESWGDDMMLVGHLPFMAKLAALLTTGDDSCDVVAFTPGTVLCLERSDGGGWRIAWMLRPELV